MAEFDRHASSYEEAMAASIGFAGREHEFFTRLKAHALLDVVRRLVGDPGGLAFLDVGCGIGLTDVQLAGSVGSLAGVDVSAPALAQAREANPQVDYRLQEGARIPHEDGRFDVAFAVNVLHHLPAADRPAFAHDLGRVVRAEGLSVVFEHNPLNPLTRLAVARCVFDEDAVLLRRRETIGLLARAGLAPVESRYVVFFPWPGEGFRRMERRLGRLPLGAQYYCAARKPI